MAKIQKLKFFALLLIVAALTGLSHQQASAQGSLPVSGSDGQKLLNYCKNNLPKNSKSSTVAGCAYGYTLAISGKKSSECDSQFKKDKDAAKACKDPGYSAGQKDPLGIKPKGGGGGGGSAPCTGSSCTPSPTGAGKNCDSYSNCDLISLYVNPFIRLLTIIVGLVVAASLVLGGVQYSASSGDAQKISAAKSRISNTLLALIAYAFMYGFLNFIIPGGIF